MRRVAYAEGLELRMLPSAGSTASSALAISAEVAQASDRDGSGIVITPQVIIDGQTAPGATVRLAQTPRGSIRETTTADAQGNYRLSLNLREGQRTFRLTATERDQTASTTLTVLRGDAVIDANAVLLNAIRAAGASPTEASRDGAMVMVAVYDAVDAVDKIAQPYKIKLAAAPGTSAVAASAAAARTVLDSLFPSQSSTFAAMLQEELATVPNARARTEGVRLGDRAGDAILTLRANDGSSTPTDYSPSGRPGTWVPTPPDFAPAVTPQWGSVTPWALVSGSQFLPPPPPAIDSPQYAAELNQVEALGEATSTVRTPEETASARLWSDQTGTTFTPPGHWNLIGEEAAMERPASLASNARTFALLDMALADAGIAGWNAKFTYNTWRPVTAIRNGDDGLNPGVTANPTWTPLWPTPAFPAYVSGHSTFSAAAAAVLTSIYGPNFAFTDAGDPSLENAPQRFASFEDAAAQSGMSRILGGIHFMSDNVAGLALGAEVGQYVLQHEALHARGITNSESTRMA